MGRTLADFVRSNPTQILLVSELASDGGDRLGNRALIMLCVCVSRGPTPLMRGVARSGSDM
jgi:hypothetical protein